MKALKRLALSATILMAAASPQVKAEISLTILETASWEGSTYYLLDKSSWHGAQSAAVELGGNLVTISNPDEQAFIDNLWGAFGSSTYATTYLWNGLTDASNEGQFEWVSGEEFLYDNFHVNEPNGFTFENEVYMWYRAPEAAGTWNDFDGSRGYNYYDGVYGVVEVVDNPLGLSSLSNIANVPSPHLGAICAFALLAFGANIRNKKALN